MLSVVDYPLAPSIGARYDSISKQVRYAPPSGGYKSFAGSLEIVAHEWGHGVTDFASKLKPVGESGALNESFSDMLGAAFKYARQDPLWYWNGEDVTPPPGGPLADLSNPTATGQADTYPCTSSPPCGIFENTGIPNKVFYLFAAPGSHFHNGITVNGIGVHNAMKVMLLANEGRFWSPTTNFAGAMRGSLLAAAHLEPSYSQWASQLLKAWEAVKVCWPNGDVNKIDGPNQEDIIPLLICIFDLGMEDGLCDRCNSDVDCDGLPTPADIVTTLSMVHKGAQNVCPP